MRSLSVAMLFSSLFLLAGNAKAGPDDLCICQMGDEPKEQVPAFFAGCEAWLNLQLCLRKKIVSISKPLIDVVDNGMKPRSMRVGFVGHWSSANESVNFLKEEVVPVIQKYDVRVKVDNTACLAVDNPYTVANYLKGIEEGSKIRFTGNQAISSGMWDKFIPGKNNFWSKIEGKTGEVTFPSCKKFENRVCYTIFQGGEKGVCHDKKTGAHVVLKCEGESLEYFSQDPKDILKDGGLGVLKKLDRWKRQVVTLSKSKGFHNGKVSVFSSFGVGYGSSNFETEAEADAFIEKAKFDVRLILQNQAVK